MIVGLAVLAMAAGCTSRSGDDEPTKQDDTASQAAEARDEAVDAAGEIAETLTTIDPADVEGTLDAWEDAVTGDLLTEFESNRATSVEQLREAGSESTGEALTAAATDVDKGNATVLVALKATITQDGGEPADSFRRMRLTLTLTDDGWKADGVENVAYGG